jgi:hypothetical protein
MNRSVFAFKMIEFIFQEQKKKNTAGINNNDTEEDERIMVFIKHLVNDLFTVIDLHNGGGGNYGNNFSQMFAIIPVMNEMISFIPLPLDQLISSKRRHQRKVAKQQKKISLFKKIFQIEEFLHLLEAADMDKLLNASVLVDGNNSEEEGKQSNRGKSIGNLQQQSLVSFMNSLKTFSYENSPGEENGEEADLLNKNDDDEDNDGNSSDGEETQDQDSSSAATAISSRKNYLTVLKSFHQRILYFLSFNHVESQRQLLEILERLLIRVYFIHQRSFQQLLYLTNKILINKLKELFSLFRMKLFVSLFAPSSSHPSMKKRIQQSNKLEFDSGDVLAMKLMIWEQKKENETSTSLVPSASSSQQHEENPLESLYQRLFLFPMYYNYYHLMILLDASFFSYKLSEELIPELMKLLVIYTKIFIHFDHSTSSSSSSSPTKAIKNDSKENDNNNSFMKKFLLNDKMKLSFLTFLYDCFLNETFLLIFEKYEAFDFFKSLIWYLLVYFTSFEVTVHPLLFLLFFSNVVFLSFCIGE